MQSNRARLTLVTLLGTLALGALTAAAAQAVVAPSWSIEGTTLPEGKTHYITGKIYTTKEHPRITLASGEGVAKRTISCLAARLKEGVLLGSTGTENGAKNSEAIEFFGNCEVTGNGPSCKVTEPIVTNPLKSELVETEKAVPGTSGSLLTLFEAEKESLGFLTIHFTGTCTATETRCSGKVAAQVLTDPENGTLGTLVELPNTSPKSAKSWLLNLPQTPITKVTRISGGKVTEIKVELTAFTESSAITGTVLVLLAKKNSKGELESETTLWSPLP